MGMLDFLARIGAPRPAESFAVTSWLGAAKGPFPSREDAEEYADKHGGRVIRMVEEA